MRTRSRYYPSPPRSRVPPSGAPVPDAILRVRLEILKGYEICRLLHGKILSLDCRLRRLPAVSQRYNIRLRLQTYMGVARCYVRFVDKKRLELSDLIEDSLGRSWESEYSSDEDL